MVETAEEKTNLENLKHKNKRELITMQYQYSALEHKRKMERLEKTLEIAKAGGESADI